jgi:hypothetical protein
VFVCVCIYLEWDKFLMMKIYLFIFLRFV